MVRSGHFVRVKRSDPRLILRSIGFLFPCFFDVYRLLLRLYVLFVMLPNIIVNLICCLLIRIRLSLIPLKSKYLLNLACEMLNLVAIRANAAPKDGDFKFSISQYESELRAGTVDNTVEPVYKKLPEWEETLESARARYVAVVKALADKYPSENLLLVTHGVGSIFTELNKDATVLEVEYCGHLYAKRTIQSRENQSFTAGELVYSEQTGILSASK